MQGQHKLKGFSTSLIFSSLLHVIIQVTEFQPKMTWNIFLGDFSHIILQNCELYKQKNIRLKLNSLVFTALKICFYFTRTSLVAYLVHPIKHTVIHIWNVIRYRMWQSVIRNVLCCSDSPELFAIKENNIWGERALPKLILTGVVLFISVYSKKKKAICFWNAFGGFKNSVWTDRIYYWVSMFCISDPGVFTVK